MIESVDCIKWLRDFLINVSGHDFVHYAKQFYTRSAWQEMNISSMVQWRTVMWFQKSVNSLLNLRAACIKIRNEMWHWCWREDVGIEKGALPFLLKSDGRLRNNRTSGWYVSSLCFFHTFTLSIRLQWHAHNIVLLCRLYIARARNPGWVDIDVSWLYISFNPPLLHGMWAPLRYFPVTWWSKRCTGSSIVILPAIRMCHKTKEMGRFILIRKEAGGQPVGSPTQALVTCLVLGPDGFFWSDHLSKAFSRRPRPFVIVGWVSGKASTSENLRWYL